LLEILAQLRTGIRITDLIDITIVTFIIYRILLLIRGTRAMQMATGLMILGIVFFAASTQGLYITLWILSHFFDYMILIVIVLFQDDLRRALTLVGKNPFFASASEEANYEMITEISRAATRMAKERIGGLIVIERETGLKNFIDTGSELESKVKSELIYSIFVPSSPLHDGAVIITDGRIAAAGCFLPLSKDPNIDKRYGTRHRAALGLTEDTDAIVVVISEEAGEVHLVKNGKITMNLNEQEIRQSLATLLELKRGQGIIPDRMRGWLQSMDVND